MAETTEPVKRREGTWPAAALVPCLFGAPPREGGTLGGTLSVMFLVILLTMLLMLEAVVPLLRGRDEVTFPGEPCGDL